MPYKPFFVVAVVFVFNNPNVGTILTNFSTVGAVPTDIEVVRFKHDFTPAVENKHVKFNNVSSLRLEYRIESISIWSEGVGNINNGVKGNGDVILSYTAVLIHKLNGVGGVLLCAHARGLTIWTGQIRRGMPRVTA